MEGGLGGEGRDKKVWDLGLEEGGKPISWCGSGTMGEGRDPQVGEWQRAEGELGTYETFSRRVALACARIKAPQDARKIPTRGVLWGGSRITATAEHRADHASA